MKRVLIILIIGSLALPSLAQRRGGQQQTVQRGSAFSQETIVIRPYQVVRGEIIITPDMLVADRRRMYQGGRELSQAEVRAIMANTDALRLYNKSLRRNRIGNIAFYSGLVATVGGVVTLTTRPFEGRLIVSNISSGWAGVSVYYRHEHQNRSYVIGGVLAGVGLASTITGLSINRSSRLILRESADSFNRGLGHSSTTMDLNFEFTGNGLGLVLRF